MPLIASCTVGVNSEFSALICSKCQMFMHLSSEAVGVLPFHVGGRQFSSGYKRPGYPSRINWYLDPDFMTGKDATCSSGYNQVQSLNRWSKLWAYVSPYTSQSYRRRWPYLIIYFMQPTTVISGLHWIVITIFIIVVSFISFSVG